MFRAGFLRSGVDPLTVGRMSLYELISTSAALELLQSSDEKENPEVSDEEWQTSMDTIQNLAKFDPTIRLE